MYDLRSAQGEFYKKQIDNLTFAGYNVNRVISFAVGPTADIKQTSIRKEKTMQNIIEIRNLTKSFGDIRAVRDLSFSVRRGELFAFLDNVRPA